MDLQFVPRSELSDREWDDDAKAWKRPSIDRETLRRLNRRSTLEGTIRLVAHTGALVATAWLTAYTARFSYLLAVVPYLLFAFLVGFLNGIEHEMRHKIVFSRRLDWLNDVVYFLIHVLWKAGSRNQRVSHVIHHRYTMVDGVDPEPAFPREITVRWVRKELFHYLFTVVTLGIPVFFRAMWTLIQRTGGRLHPMIQAKCSDHDLKVIRWESFAILVINLAALAVFIVWRQWVVIALFILGPFVGNAIAAFWHRTEHIGMMHDANDQRLCTRGVKVSPIVKFLYGGLDEHVEHHLFPAVPSRNLTALREAIDWSIPERTNVIRCWREIIEIARHKEAHREDEFVPQY